LTNSFGREEDVLQKNATATMSQYDNLAVSLSLMVKRVLVELGETLWGRRCFVCNFRFQSYKSYSHQTWRIAKGWFPQSTSDRVSVMLSPDMKRFYVCCSDLDHINCCAMDSFGLSEQDLTESLIKACVQKNWSL